MNGEKVFFCNYSIGTDTWKEVPSVCGLYGKRILLIGGKKALHAGKEHLVQAIAETCMELVETVIFGEDCTYENIHRWAAYAKEKQVDMIFGMGGGKALDTAKGAGYETGLPVFTFPTIAATCAATTALSVVYKENGTFDSFYFYECPARHYFIDLEVIAKAPDRYLQAGMGGTLGKYFECHFAARGDQLQTCRRISRKRSAGKWYGSSHGYGL